jgi:hypothetical protein
VKENRKNGVLYPKEASSNFNDEEIEENDEVFLNDDNESNEESPSALTTSAVFSDMSSEFGSSVSSKNENLSSSSPLTPSQSLFGADKKGVAELAKSKSQNESELKASDSKDSKVILFLFFLFKLKLNI